MRCPARLCSWANSHWRQEPARSQPAIWRSTQGRSWILVLNGLALGALGSIFTFWTGPLAFRTIALLLVIIAMSIGIFDCVIARALRRQRHVADEWFLGLAGAAS